MKSEVWRVSREFAHGMFSTVGSIPTHGPDNPHTVGTLRWQAPELMAGGDSQFLAPMDTYAFAICCIEILTMGSLPWPFLDDDVVRHLVLSAFLLSYYFWRSLTAIQRRTDGRTSRMITSGPRSSSKSLECVGSSSPLLARSFPKSLPVLGSSGRSTTYHCNTRLRTMR